MDTKTKEIWNKAAEQYQAMLTKEDEYPQKLTDFLRKNNILTDGCHVADIGCGVGRYALLFSKYGCGLTLIDISDDMLKFAKENLEKRGIPSSQYVCDFKDMDIKEAGLEKSVDLAFAAMTPAVKTKSDIEKMCLMSRKFCFISRFISMDNLLEKGAAKYCGIALPFNNAGFGRYEEALNDILSLGYDPEVIFLPYNWENKHTPKEAEDLILNGRNGQLFYEKAEKLREYIKSITENDGYVRETVHTKAVWIIWNTDKTFSWAL